jgi:hypothetical protein
MVEVFDLEDSPVYEALSYVWGPTHPRKHVICNGVSVEINPNISLALHRLRYPSDRKIDRIKRAFGSRKRTGIRRICIDALCINQELVERSNQVKFMKEIYDAAVDVVVWMGEDTKHAADAITLIRRIASVARIDPEYDPKDPVRIGFDFNCPLRKDLRSADDHIWGWLNSFLQNKWFQRIWVIQEVARDDARMILGPHELSFLDFQLCSSWTIQKGYTSKVIGLKNASLARSFPFIAFRRAASLSSMLSFTPAMAASNPRDQIYALLGFYSMFLKKMKLDTHPVKVDYTMPVKELYQECVRYCINLPRDHFEEAGSLIVMLSNEGLCLEGGGWVIPPNPAEDRIFPSWVPR